MWNTRLLLLAVAILGACLTAMPPAPAVSRQIEISFPASEDTRSLWLELGSSRVLAAVSGPTKRGNGVLELPGLVVRIYDDYDDGLIYQGHQLHVATTRGWEGAFYLEVSGIGLVSPDDKAPSTEPVAIHGRYRFDQSGGHSSSTRRPRPS